MALAGVGIDLVDVSRLEQALAHRPRLAERLFTSDERRYAETRGNPAQHLAVRFCAKEAVAKSLGLESWAFTDVEVVAGSPPSVRLAGRAERRAQELGVSSIRVSLSHSREVAAAVVCAERGD